MLLVLHVHDLPVSLYVCLVASHRSALHYARITRVATPTYAEHALHCCMSDRKCRQQKVRLFVKFGPDAHHDPAADASQGPGSSDSQGSMSGAQWGPPQVVLQLGRRYTRRHVARPIAVLCGAIGATMASVQLVWQLPVACVRIAVREVSAGLQDMDCLSLNVAAWELRIPRLWLPSVADVLGLAAGSVVAMLLICGLLAHATSLRSAYLMG